MDFEDKMNRPAPPVVTQLPSKYTPIKMIVNSLVHMMVGIVVYVVWKVALQTYSGKFQLHILFNVLAVSLYMFYIFIIFFQFINFYS